MPRTPEQNKKWCKEYRLRNLDRLREYDRNRRELKNQQQNTRYSTSLRYRFVARRNASIHREIDWNLSEKQFCEMVILPCHYCGVNAEFNDSTRNSGLDRKDNLIGYHIDNCVPCCYMCNTIKRSKTWEKWLRFCQAQHNRLNGKPYKKYRTKANISDLDKIGNHYPTFAS